jgi:hypothetical protein
MAGGGFGVGAGSSPPSLELHATSSPTASSDERASSRTRQLYRLE